MVMCGCGEFRKSTDFKSVVDRAYRSVWCRGNKPPLMQMQREGKNMADVRKDLRVMSVRWKIEKRVLGMEDGGREDG